MSNAIPTRHAVLLTSDGTPNRRVCVRNAPTSEVGCYRRRRSRPGCAHRTRARFSREGNSKKEDEKNRNRPLSETTTATDIDDALRSSTTPMTLSKRCVSFFYTRVETRNSKRTRDSYGACRDTPPDWSRHGTLGDDALPPANRFATFTRKCGSGVPRCVRAFGISRISAM